MSLMTGLLGQVDLGVRSDPEDPWLHRWVCEQLEMAIHVMTRLDWKSRRKAWGMLRLLLLS